MSALVKDGKKNIVIRQRAASLVQNLPQKDRLGEIRALFDFVKDHIRYVRDVRNVETQYFPEQILNQEYGDCNNKSVLLASLLEAIGHPTRFSAVGFEPERFSHVFVDTAIGTNTRGTNIHNNRKWLSLDPTENKPMGWRPPGIVNWLPWYN
jgi:transglutaminase-like putative cysteine protease